MWLFWEQFIEQHFFSFVFFLACTVYCCWWTSRQTTVGHLEPRSSRFQLSLDERSIITLGRRRFSSEIRAGIRTVDSELNYNWMQNIESSKLVFKLKGFSEGVRQSSSLTKVQLDKVPTWPSTNLTKVQLDKDPTWQRFRSIFLYRWKVRFRQCVMFEIQTSNELKWPHWLSWQF